MTQYGRPIRDPAERADQAKKSEISASVDSIFPEKSTWWDVFQIWDFIRLTVKAPIFTLSSIAAGVTGTYVAFTVDPFWWAVFLLFVIVGVGAMTGYGLQLAINKCIRHISQSR